MSYLVTTGDGLQHHLSDIDDDAIAAYSSSANTRAALVQAIAAGNYASAPPPAVLPPEPDPSAFRSALAREATWQTWGSTLPSVIYTNLTIAAAQDNWTEAEAIYAAAAQLSPPAPAATAAWQALADLYVIPITF